MGIFSGLFGTKEVKDKKVLPWISLNTLNQLEEIAKTSQTKTQFIFKHSTRCGISRMVLNQFIEAYNLSEQQADLYYLDLLNYRSISDEVGYKFQVLHQSPQMLVVRNGVVVAHASHAEINNLNLPSFI